jgi:PAS domain S-box-containing protein
MFYDVRAPLAAAPGTSEGGGWLVARMYLAPQEAGHVLGDLVGPEAVFLIAPADADGSWVDLTRTVEAPVDGGGRGEHVWQGTAYVAGMAPIGATAWRAWVGLPRARLLAPARALAGRMALVGALIVLLGAFVALLLGRHVSRPISALMRGVESIASGRYAERVPVRGRNEVARLATAFNGMAERVEGARRDLESQVDQLNRTFAAVNDGLLVTTGDGVIVRGNRAAGRITGLEPSALVGRHIGALLVPAEPAGSGRALDEFRIARPGGDTRIVQATVAEFAPDRLVHTVRDITEQRAIEARLRAAQKMEALGQLAGGVAHDFNNILTAIRGYADMVRERCSDPAVLDPAMLEDLDEIILAAERASDLTRQLLAFSRRQVTQPRVVALADIVGGASNMLRRMIRSDIRLELDVARRDACVRADPIQIEQILINLVVNARDALPDGGRIKVECARVDLDAEASRRLSPAARAGRFALLRVRDTGAGIPPDVLPHIFEPLFTTKDAGQGTGLGLSTVHGLVQQLGGFIAVESSAGSGTAFDIYLPHEDAAPDTVARTPARPVLPATGERILVADDDAAIRRLVLQHLGRRGYVVLQAASGAEVLDLLGRGHAIDLLLTDVVLPGMNGWELGRRVASSQPRARVLYMSGYAPDELRGAITDPGVAYIPKPFTPAQLIARIRAVLDSAAPTPMS